MWLISIKWIALVVMKLKGKTLTQVYARGITANTLFSTIQGKIAAKHCNQNPITCSGTQTFKLERPLLLHLNLGNAVYYIHYCWWLSKSNVDNTINLTGLNPLNRLMLGFFLVKLPSEFLTRRNILGLSGIITATTTNYFRLPDRTTTAFKRR